MESARVLDNEGTTSLLRGTEIVEGPALAEAWAAWCVEGDPPTTSHGVSRLKLRILINVRYSSDTFIEYLD